MKREENTTYIATISGGKDSTCLVDLLLKNGYPVDYIVFSDTLQEFRLMYDYIEKLKEYFKNRYNKEITILKPKSTFQHWCFGKITKGDRKGLIRGIPTVDGGVCYWRRESKVKPMDNFIKDFDKVTIYIGYTLKENRSVQDTDKVTYLYPFKTDFKMTEEDCTKYLIDQEMENPLYRYFTRTGCSMCPYQSDKSFYEIWKNFPEDWQYMKYIEAELLSMDNVINPYWFTRHRTCEDMEKIFKEKDMQGSLFDFSDEPLKDCFCKI